MKKVAIASLLTVSAVSAFSILAVPARAQQPAAQIQMDPAEFTDYDNAINKQTTPQTQAPAIEAYLAKYPKSAVKADVLQRLMLDYYQIDVSTQAADHTKTLDAADRFLQVSPGNPQALTIEAAFRAQTALAATDPAAKQASYDSAANYAQQALNVTKPAGMSDADFATFKTSVAPTLYSTIGAADLNKGDNAGAIAAYKSELAATPIAQTQAPGTALQDTYYLGQAYYQMKPADLVNCTFYTTRAASYAPDNFKAQLQPLATYCYKKYHGGVDGYDAVVAAAKANLMPPADFTIVAAPTNEDVIKKTIADTPDLASLAIDDKEFIIANGKPDDADKVFNAVKGKTTEFPEALVVKATAEQVQVAVGQDAVQNKVADLSFNMKTPLTKIPAVGSKVTLMGTYSSYTQSPLLIIMDGSEVVEAKKAAPVKKAPVRRTR